MNNYDELKKRLNESILQNIKLDIRAFFLVGKEIPIRDKKWDSYTKEQMELIKQELEIEEEIRHEKVLKKIHRDKKEKRSYIEWKAIADSLYTKEENDDCLWIVTSYAKGLERIRTEICESRKDANKYIESLIKIKYYDHFIRGYDFRWDPTKEEKE